MPKSCHAKPWTSNPVRYLQQKYIIRRRVGVSSIVANTSFSDLPILTIQIARSVICSCTLQPYSRYPACVEAAPHRVCGGPSSDFLSNSSSSVASPSSLDAYCRTWPLLLLSCGRALLLRLREARRVPHPGPIPGDYQNTITYSSYTPTVSV